MSSLLAPLVLTLGVGTSLHQGPQVLEDANASFKVTAGVEKVYLWGTYDTNTSGLLAQPFSNNEVMGFGIGARKSWGDFLGYLETGLYITDLNDNPAIQHEVVYTHLVGRHAVSGRGVPVDNAYKGYTTSYEADDGLFLRVGVQYQLWEHVAVGASYRWLEVDTELTLKREGWSDGGGYWREDNTLDLSAAEVTLVYTF
jgi:opacity protein-like surface antigen